MNKEKPLKKVYKTWIAKNEQNLAKDFGVLLVLKKDKPKAGTLTFFKS